MIISLDFQAVSKQSEDVPLCGAANGAHNDERASEAKFVAEVDLSTYSARHVDKFYHHEVISADAAYWSGMESR